MDKAFVIVINEIVQNCPLNRAITLLDLQDSCCPVGVQCIWAGMIFIEVALTIDGKDLDLQLGTNETVGGFPLEYSTSDYSVKLIDAILFNSKFSFQYGR